MSFEHGDGHVGAVVGNSEWFITSPNMEFVPEPAVGHTCNMRIHANFQYGEEDPLQLPQLYLVLGQHQNPTLWITCGLYKGMQRF